MNFRPAAPPGFGRTAPSLRSASGLTVDSTGRRNTLGWEVGMAGPRRSDRALRSKLRSPGRPPVAQQAHRRRFWVLIAAGQSSEDAAIGAGVSAPVGARWFRKSGGMPPSTLAPSLKPLSGRYLSFAEREEIAIQHAQGGRSPGTWGGRDRRSRESFGATLPRAAASWIIGPLRRNGMLNGPLDARRQQS